MDSATKIDVEYEVETGDSDADALTFQDIPHSSGDSGKSKTHEFTNFPHSAVDSDEEADEDSAQLLKDEQTSPSSSSSFWTFAYYQQFFDVDTKQVGKRIIGSMLPRPGNSYLIKEIRPKPDLYGPFWICTTLVFTTAIAGNLANYFSSGGKNYHWKYDFHKGTNESDREVGKSSVLNYNSIQGILSLRAPSYNHLPDILSVRAERVKQVTFAATAIYSYWWFIPLILFGLLWWRGSKEKLTFLEIICVYGYSLAIYIPISVLWAIQVAWLQWLLVVIGAVLSGSVLLMNFWPIVSEDNKRIALGIMAFIFIMHAALAAGFVLYFFYVPTPSQSTPTTPIINTTLTPAYAQMLIASKLPETAGVKLAIQTATKGIKKAKEERVAKGLSDKPPSGTPNKLSTNFRGIKKADTALQPSVPT